MSKPENIESLLQAVGSYALRDGDFLQNDETFVDLCEEIAALQADAAKWHNLGELPPDDTEAGLLAICTNIIDVANQTDFVVRIETRPLQPLAMGNYEMVASVEPRRVPAVPYDQLNRVKS